MPNILDIAGKRFGKLVTVRRMLKPTKFGEVRWECLCDCGNLAHPTGRNLKLGKTKSCGCLLKEAPAKHSGKASSTNWTGHGEISGTYWAAVQKHAKLRNRTFNVTIQQAWDQFVKQDRKCALSGELIQFNKPGRQHRNSITASLDRIDSSKGYTPDNIQWLHKHVNIMKWNLTEDRFIELCKKIVTQRKT